MELANKVVLITGAARRVGRAIALDLSSRGAIIAAHYRRSIEEAEELKALIEKEDGRAEIFQADLADFSDISALTGQVVSCFNRIDILVNNASIFERTPLSDLSESDWDRHLDINLKAPFFLSRDAGSYMRKQGAGKIINIADSEIGTPWPGYLPYSISKSALVTMTRGLARIFAPEIQVNAIGPGTVLLPDDYREEEAERTMEQIPARRFGEPADIVGAVRYLIEAGDYVTGAFIPVDGGYSVR